MASKRSYNEISDSETEHSVDRPKAAKLNCPTDSSSSSSQHEVETLPESGQKMPDKPGHGNRFQYKLLTLYALRAINIGYQFYLGTELPDVGDKFDDLIFYYKYQNENTFRKQYLQAKHKLKENDRAKQITANDLLDVKKGDFSLLKYFQSYVKIRSQGNYIEHCIICTNVEFNHIDITNNGIKLEHVDEKNWPKLLNCKDIKPDQACYKLTYSGNFKKSSSVNIKICVTKCTGEEMKSLFQNCTEVVDGKPFNNHTADEMKTFINSKNQNQLVEVRKLVEIVFDDFLDKLLFVVKTPNEDEFNPILATEVGKYFKLSNAKLPSTYIMNEMVNWFKLTGEKHHWLTAEETKEILNDKTHELMALYHFTSLSIDYQDKVLKTEELEFYDTAFSQLTPTLELFWNSQENIKCFSSETPKLTAVQFISAIKKMPHFPYKDDYLVISAKRLGEDFKEIEERLKVKTCLRLFLIVNEEENNAQDVHFYEGLSKKINKKFLLISNKKFNKGGSIDTISYGHLSEKTKEFLGKRQVPFQGTDLSVNDLIDENHKGNLFNPKLIENLLHTPDDKTNSVSSFISPSFDGSSYINRKIKFVSEDFPLKDLSNSVSKGININSDGKIQWLIQDDQHREEIWKKIKTELERNQSIDEEEKLIDSKNKRIIITGVAGTGKSTILSHYYDEIKKNVKGSLVIKISLTKYSKALKETNQINDFLINKVIDQNAFARQLLKHRLETGERIILMLDGFDEIDSDCQNKVIRLVKDLNESIPLYITTRPHLAEKLQLELSPLAYSLEKFTEEDQIKYLTLIWTTFLTKENVEYKEEAVKKFATDLIEHVSEILNDKEKQYCGIPLHCRILAECFQSKIKIKLSNQNADANYDLSHLLDEDKQFDLASLFKSLMDEKERILREEKIPVKLGESLVIDKEIMQSVKKTKDNLRNLAIRAIVSDEKYTKVLIPQPSKKIQSKWEEDEEKTLNDELEILSGFLDYKSIENERQFLHRSYAEYLVAEFIVNGFHLDEKHHNQLLTCGSDSKEIILNWIINKILLNEDEKYEGVRIFFDSLLKKILDSDDKQPWENVIKTRELPSRFQPFAIFLEKNKWVLIWAFRRRNANKLGLVLDCFYAFSTAATDEHRDHTSSTIFSIKLQELVRPDTKNKEIEQIRNETITMLGKAFEYSDNNEVKQTPTSLLSEIAAFFIHSDKLREQFLKFMKELTNFMENPEKVDSNPLVLNVTPESNKNYIALKEMKINVTELNEVASNGGNQDLNGGSISQNEDTLNTIVDNFQQKIINTTPEELNNRIKRVMETGALVPTIRLCENKNKQGKQISVIINSNRIITKSNEDTAANSC